MFISNSFLSSHLSSWQAHLMHNSSFLKQGKGVWWFNADETEDQLRPIASFIYNSFLLNQFLMYVYM